MDGQRDLHLMVLSDDELRSELARFRRLRAIALEDGGDCGSAPWNHWIEQIQAEIDLRVEEAGLP